MREIAISLAAEPGETIIEIGPGHAELSDFLLIYTQRAILFSLNVIKSWPIGLVRELSEAKIFK